jgi:hypothetical protein
MGAVPGLDVSENVTSRGTVPASTVAVKEAIGATVTGRGGVNLGGVLTPLSPQATIARAEDETRNFRKTDM